MLEPNISRVVRIEKINALFRAPESCEYELIGASTPNAKTSADRITGHSGIAQSQCLIFLGETRR
jgi:hypothetical protein